MSRPGLGNLAHLRFYDPGHFRAGNIHNKQDLLEKSPCVEVDLLEVIRDGVRGVRVDRFFKPFKGNFKGQAYNSNYPPPIIIKNSPTTAKFSQFVSDSIIQWVTAGVTAAWGPVNRVVPPRLVLPLTVEPSKPRLCHDEQYLNLGIRDLPFKLDHLCDLLRYVLPGHFLTSRVFVMTRVVISMSCSILRLKLILASSGTASFLSFVHVCLDGKRARSFTINSDSQFQAPRGLLGSQFRNTLIIGTLDSLLLLHCGLAGIHLSSHSLNVFQNNSPEPLRSH